MRLLLAFLAVLAGFANGPGTAVALPLEFMVLGQDAADPEAASEVMQPLRIQGGLLMDQFAPASIPLYAASDIYGYGFVHDSATSQVLGDWTSSHQPWLNSMASTLLAVRQKQILENALVQSRRAERQRRESTVQRAGQPSQLPGEGEARPGQIGVRLQDLLLQYAGASRSDAEPHFVDSGYREIDPFAAGGTDNTMDSLSQASIDAWITEEFNEMLPEDSVGRRALSFSLDVAGRTAQQFARLESQFSAFLQGSDGLAAGSKADGMPGGGSLRSGSSGAWAGNGGSGQHGKPRERQSVGLMTFALGLVIAAVTTPMTYVIAVPLAFAWFLLRMARPGRTEH